jgi:uncharacterized protein (TIGR02145 family)
MKKLTFSLLMLLFAFTGFTQERAFKLQRQEAKDHVALVIGNSNYPDMPLSNPKNDAGEVAKAFEEMGFLVEKILDADKESMSLAINRFSQRLKTARAAVFYFAGHGMQVNGENYLIPIGKTLATQITEESQVPYRAINAGEILAAMENQKVKFALVVLDACRNNPIKGSGRGKIKGLASIDAPAGSLVMYSTKAGDVANDGTGHNSPFTTAFLQHIKTPGLDVNLLPSKVTSTVLELTNGLQTPGSYMQLTQSFTFVPELTADELKNMKDAQLGDLKGQYSELQKKEAEMAKQKVEEEAILAKKQADIDKLEKQIADLKSRTGTANEAEGDLDKMLAIVKERESRKKELDELKRKAEIERQNREKEIAALKLREKEEKENKLNEDIRKYNEIANSEFGQDMKQSAWNSILKKWGIALGSIDPGDAMGLRAKVFDIPLFLNDSRDGKQYKIVEIGNQLWMAENLAFDYGSGCWAYDNNLSNVSKYGYLYNWETAKNVCPSGWHLPSDEEWKELEKYLGMSSSDADNTGWRGKVGKELKSTGGWYNSGNGTNSSGFNALPGGYRYGGGSFLSVGRNALFWSSSADGSEGAWNRYLRYNDGEVHRRGWNRTDGYSVRCLQD